LFNNNIVIHLLQVLPDTTTHLKFERFVFGIICSGPLDDSVTLAHEFRVFNDDETYRLNNTFE